MAGDVLVRPVAPGDEVGWRRLFAAYREFYRLPADDAVLDRVWAWLHDDRVAGDAATQGRSVVRWITAEDNHLARTLYDTMADATRWVTYDRTP